MGRTIEQRVAALRKARGYMAKRKHIKGELFKHDDHGRVVGCCMMGALDGALGGDTGTVYTARADLRGALRRDLLHRAIAVYNDEPWFTKAHALYWFDRAIELLQGAPRKEP